MTQTLKLVGQNIWVCEGGTVSFYGFPFPTRMTVIKLNSGDLWIHSPIEVNTALQDELSALGRVKHLIAPNKLHHLFVPAWVKAFPDAITYAAPGLSKKRPDIDFAFGLSDTPATAWEAEIKQTVFRGSPAMEEVVFFHQPSSTLILTDLIENFHPASLNWWQRKLAKFAGILYPNGKMPIDWRLSYLFGSKKKARQSLLTILQWQPEKIIVSHGECIEANGTEFLKASFSWLQKKPV